MRISTLMHGVLDFATSAMVLTMPRRLGASPALSTLLTVKALGVVGYSLMTRYELGIVKSLPMRTHLTLDALTGATMCVLPFLFSNEPAAVRGALLGMGVFELATAFSTETEPANPDLLPGASGEFADRIGQVAESAHQRVGSLSPL